MHYSVSVPNPNSHCINFEYIIPNAINNQRIALSVWRPGRYELGHFAKNIIAPKAYDKNGNPVEMVKVSKSEWQLNNQAGEIKIHYQYYANELNAGSSYAGPERLYINPVNCFMYCPDQMNSIHTVKINLDTNWEIACSLDRKDNSLVAANFDELADSPFFVAPDIQTIKFNESGTDFYLHFTGDCQPDEKKLINDFRPFCKEAIQFFGELHTSDYHFLFLILPFRFYHGVEHVKNTVIALGPSWEVFKGEMYEELLGVSCHELFHTWNVKSIRPSSMLPYNFSAENYSRLGFVYEGFTTYYGDKLLFSSKVFNEDQYLRTLNDRLMKHMHNFGRFNYPVTESSMDTWLDGYTPGVPNRKVSIYDEGNLIALMLDVKILVASKGEKSLQNVLRDLYFNFFKKGKGYSDDDIISLCEKYYGDSLTSFFQDFVYGVKDDFNELQTCLNSIGYLIEERESLFKNEAWLGIKILEGNAQATKIIALAPESNAFKKVSVGDEIIAVNNQIVKGDFSRWIEYYLSVESTVMLHLNSGNKLKAVELIKESKSLFSYYRIVPKPKVEPAASVRKSQWLLK